MPEKEFMKLFEEFYEKFFSNASESVRLLAEIQEKHPKEYNSVRKFGTDPQAMEEIIDKLDDEHQALLLRILLRAGTLGRKLAIMFDLSVKEKRKLAKDINTFAKSLKK